MMRILAYGDSNTWGFDPVTWGSATMELLRYSKEIRWTGLLQKALGKDVLILEEGLCGRTTAFDDEECDGRNGLATLPEILKANQPIDAAIILLGTNDCKIAFNASSNEITSGLEMCLKKLLDVTKPQNILIISPLYLETAAFDFGFNDRSISVSMELKQAYKELADKYGTAFLAASDVAKASSLDGQHLTEEGHRALCEAVLKHLAAMNVGTDNEPKEQIGIAFEQGNNRSAAYIDGKQIGECEITVSGNIWTITHTGVRPEYGGRGIAKKLVLSVIEAARENNAKIVPLCSYADKLMSGKEEFRDVLKTL